MADVVTRDPDNRPAPVPGLADLVLVRSDEGGLALPDDPGAALTVNALADLARDAGAGEQDLRVLMDDGARQAAIFGRLADALGRDVLVTPAGATVQPTAAAAVRTEAVPVNRASGEVVDWVLIQPASLRTGLPGWYDLAGGLVLHRGGLVTLPLPNGLEFADREGYVVRRAAASQLGTTHPNLATVALATRGGGFVLSTYRGRSGVHGADEVAAALSSIPLYGGDLRLWLCWPVDDAEQRKLDDQVRALAEATGATVWTPPVGAEAVLLKGCQDLAARDRSGQAVPWRAVRPPHTSGESVFDTDLDGRLTPADGVTIASAGEVALMSTSPRREAAMRDRYRELTAEPGMTLVDLTIMEDGRLGLRHGDGSSLAAGTAQLRRLLEMSGWRGEDLMLLTPVPPERADRLHEHLRVLEDELGVEVWTLTPGALVSVQDGLPRAVDEQRLPARWQRAAGAGPDQEGGRWRNDDGWLVPLRQRIPESAPTGAAVAEPAAMAPATAGPLPPPSPRPPLTVSARGSRPHGVRWLPERPEVNAAPVRLWLSSPWPAQRVAVEGVPSANLYLVGHLAGGPLAQTNPQRHLLCLRVEAGGAVHLGRLGVDLPADLRHQVAEGTYLLPAGWLDLARLQQGYRVDEAGQPRDPVELPANPLTLRCKGARHGADGLPNEVVFAPRGGRMWAVVPDRPGAEVTDDDLLVLLAKRPAVRAGHRLIRLQIAPNRAVDVVASAAALAGLTSVRSRLPELVANGVTMLLPSRYYERTTVDQVLHAENDRWRPRAKGIELPLSSLIAPDRR
ncbi:hypothetical protein AB0J90_25020 [Micromonospora sp. NPDC049523]|uniref:hypothetical protein n=1 Tax=Micromonospora sp. NPDC049523 TaxID=3155921 RepID=UPI0034405907